MPAKNTNKGCGLFIVGLLIMCISLGHSCFNETVKTSHAKPTGTTDIVLPKL